MKKLTLSLLLSSALLGGNLTFAEMIDGYKALSQGESLGAYQIFLKESKVNPQAAFVLGMMHYEGVGTEKNLADAQQWLMTAMNAGSKEALYNMGVLRLEGQFPTKAQDASGLTLLLQASHQKVAQATIRLGVELMENGGQSSFFTAEIIADIYDQLEEAFNAGNGFAGFILGIYWADAAQFGIDETNYQTAIDLLEKSYQQGFLPAVMGLAALYREGGYGLEANSEKAAAYQQLFVNNMENIGDFEALVPGILSLYSVMTPDEQNKMLEQLVQQARKNSVPAILELIQRYALGTGVEKNSAKVGEYLAQLEKIDTAQSLFALGSVLLKRDDESRAQQYIKVAAERDYLPAIHWLSDPIHHPWNVDEAIIAKYVLQGANLGDRQSIHAVIRQLENERSNAGWWNDSARPVALIDQEIYQWAQKLQASAPENVETYLLLSDIYRSGTGTDADAVKAFDYMMQAYGYAPDNSTVLLSLAQMTKEGTGVEQDLELAASYYLKAKAYDTSAASIEGLLQLNQMTIGFKGNRALQSQLLGITLDEYANQNQYVPILDQLLNALEVYIETHEEETVYGYLLADRYFSQYMTLQSAIKNRPEQALELIEKRDEMQRKADYFFKNAYHNSEQAKLHYAQALLILRKDAIDDELAQDLATEARRVLRDISSLTDTPDELNDNPHYLNEREQVRAMESIMQLLDGSDAFQDWFGDGVLINNPFAMGALTKMVAEKGDEAPAFATYYLGKQELKSDPKIGYARIVQAANQNYLPAIYYLGQAYYEAQAPLIAHLGGSKQSAIYWYEKGLAFNEDKAIYALAELYLNNEIGLDLPAIAADLKAIEYYQKLSDPDYRFAKYHLKEAQERVEAYQAIQKGLSVNDAQAFYQQSEIYRYGQYGETQDLQKADEHLLKAADMGSLQAMRDYYSRYREDQTITGDTLMRFNRYHIAYVHGAKEDWETQRLADRYLIGDRITESRQKAREYYEFALKNDSGSSASYDLGYMNRFDQNMPLAEKGNAEAMLVIGRAYDSGNGVKKDLEKAYHWLQKAANAGNSDAAFYFGVIAQSGVMTDDGTIIIAPNWDVALQWYEKASPRFKNAITGRVQEYETIHYPAQNGDSKAMIALADLYAQRYHSYEKAYDWQLAKLWYEKSLASGEMTAHFGLMKLLPEAEQARYLQTVMENAGNAAFKIQLSKMIMAQRGEAFTAEQLQLAVDNLVEVMEDSDIDATYRFEAIKQLISLYHRDYRLQDGLMVSAPDFEGNKNRVLRHSDDFPAIKRLVGDMFDARDDGTLAMEFWQEAIDAGDYVAVLRMYRQLLPGYYDEITLQDLTRIEALYRQYLTLVPPFPLGPTDYTAFIAEHDIEGVLDNSTRSEMSRMLATFWQKNGHDFMADRERSKQWYQHALTLHVSKDTVANLIQITDAQYAENPENLQYLAELYLYGGIYEGTEAMVYPFERLTALSKLALDSQVQAYQDERDYARDKWVMISHQKESDAGDAGSSLALADNYRYGRYTRRSLEKAIEYYELAGSRGEATAYNRLGNMFRKNEENIEPDYPRALAYFEKGAALGDSNTAHLAGDMYYFGEGGIDKNYAKAAEYFAMTELAQGNHHALAKYKQAEIIYNGWIAPPTIDDYQIAFDLLQLAAEYGESLAIKALATWDFSELAASKKMNDI